ncbi:hypothetical protein H072_3255 [Dactylellina haptotyla CBS 200.50]|uniref:Uncharacterized protein n=1 Tax=Dactylellina haptotyla (strain CBS 200.50) TaxID=1284197 RepID=S8AIC2_DACHA|nr:hypothetical protein H072_3255 [Dactylellina haptotyla CBS 200.50]
MPCASPYLPFRTYHTFPQDAPDDLKTLMRHGFKEDMAKRILETRGMTNWEVLQSDCTALFFKKYWDRMNRNIANQMRRRQMENEIQSVTSKETSSDTATPILARQKKCAIL